MTVVLVDETLAIDSNTMRTRALDGAARAFVCLAEAMALRGCTVVALTRTPLAVTTRGVRWEPLAEDWAEGGPRTGAAPLVEQARLVIAFRNPQLLGVVREAGTRVLYALGPGGYLNAPPCREALDRYRPRVVLPGEVARYACPLEDVTVIAPGVDLAFHPRSSSEDAPPPVAITTTHPSQGLAPLLDLWRTQVHRELPEARLHIYSALLHGALHGASVDAEIATLAEKVLELGDAGVSVKEPRPATRMAEAFRDARVHLYPGHPRDLVCWSLAETQACGVPGVALTRGAAGERLTNGETGMLVPDFDALCNVGVAILKEDSFWRSLHEGTRVSRKYPRWDQVAELFEALA
ncbi:glycosyltransferase [Phaeovibrio sulfidiphilus]|uniref:Glycosyltransferase n=1 Tax=Phaeovibrio sulfidiphilus TaxID=1220600 RepID=A0A8J6YJD1_9PROT|nr:glycosyltransferase [Phaeovibrio sulfidiphilus]MBE1237416.1 glycosyltransferase [Phaeovibrio sulfidiphilus]